MTYQTKPHLPPQTQTYLTLSTVFKVFKNAAVCQINPEKEAGVACCPVSSIIFMQFRADFEYISWS